MRRLKGSTMPLVCGWKGWVRRWVMDCCRRSGRRVAARGFVVGFGLFVDGEAVGEFRTVVGQDGVDREREAGKKAFEKGGGGCGPTIGEDFEIDKAGRGRSRHRRSCAGGPAAADI